MDQGLQSKLEKIQEAIETFAERMKDLNEEVKTLAGL